MRKKEFMKELQEHLIGIKEEDREEILEDYEEHFKIGKKKKRKEEEISKALGTPKTIARDIRKELKGDKKISFEDEAVEFWVELKKGAKKIWSDIKETVEEKREKKIKKKEKPKKKKDKKDRAKRDRKTGKIVSLILFNFLIMIWVWIAFFSAIVSLIISGWSIVLSGAVSLIGIIFSFLVPVSPAVNSLLWAGLFASISLTFFGLIFSLLSWKLGKGFFWLTGKYLRWNNKIFGGKK